MILCILVSREHSLQYSEEQSTLNECEIMENYDEIVASLEAHGIKNE